MKDWLYRLKETQIKFAIPRIERVAKPLKPEGQKVVFPCEMGGKRYALKFLIPKQGEWDNNIEESSDHYSESIARAEREIDIMKRCKSPHIVRMGPIGLTKMEIGGKEVAYYTEEWIEGENLRNLIDKTGQLTLDLVIRLGIDIAEPIEEIWSLQRLHRDIKPKNIIWRSILEDFVLLDMGIAFAMDEESITRNGYVLGTMPYFCPEQFDFTKRRDMDFRSDLFSLGIVLYEAATGEHPFFEKDISQGELCDRICRHTHAPPSRIKDGLPPKFDRVINRLLAKKKHMRYNSFSQFRDELKLISR